jgi:hypothetical protein
MSDRSIADCAFRPNVIVVMTVALEMFDAVQCLDLIEEGLLGPIRVNALDLRSGVARPPFESRI